MNKKHLISVYIFIGLFLVSLTASSQKEEEATDDLGNVTSTFQNHFYEALKQKAIENYELAIKALKKAEKSVKGNKENKAVVHYEMGKNYAKLKEYQLAEINFNKVLEWDDDRLDVMESLYDLYYAQRNYEAALPLVQRLIPYDDDYKEDLANLYSRTKQYDKAIIVLDELDEIWGESNYRDSLRSQIYRAMGNSSKDIEKLVNKINNEPKKEKEYLNLIYLYSEQGKPDKAFETAKELLKKNPESELVHLALYKFYLDEGSSQKAFQSMRIVFSSYQIDMKSKLRVLEDFLEFVTLNPQYEPDIESIISLFPDKNESKIYELIGKYFMVKGDNEKALINFELGLKGSQDNYSLIKNTLLLQIDHKKFEDASILSRDALEVFPAQPLLYLLNGVSNINLKNVDTAIESLETGLDYLFENPKMEREFYEQMSKAYTLKNDVVKANLYSKKASEVQIPE